MHRRPSRRAAAFALVVIACVAVGSASVARAVLRAHSSAPPPGVRVVAGASLAGVAHTLETTRAASLAAGRGPQLLFRSAIPDKSYGKLAVASLSDPDATRAISDLSCDRVYFAAGNGLCLAATGAFASHYVAKIFDENFKVVRTLSLPGIPSRARVSSDGRLGVFTTFVNGDSYAPGNFSTRTTIISMKTGVPIVGLEQFGVTRDGRRFNNRNFNFWGVTFEPDDNHFYATLGSGANTYLVRGSIATRKMTVVYTHLECPSLSPDGTRIAFKRSLDSHGSWRLYVLDLRTLKTHPLAETESVDDQAEWLDDTHVLYWRAGNIWVVPADGTGKPAVFASDASSPVVVR